MTEPLDLEPIKARLADYWNDRRMHRAPEDVEALIAEVERLRGEVAYWEQRETDRYPYG